MEINENDTFEKFQKKLKQYGWCGTLLSMVKKIIRKLTAFSWDKYFLMVRKTDNLPPLPDKSFTVRELALADYESPLWASFLDDDKKRLYIERFANPNAKAYGVFVNQELAYSTWILYGEVVIRSRFHYSVPKDALLLDSYSHPKFRGMGLHNYMNLWCLHKMAQEGAENAFVVVLSYNRPAIKTQTKCGLRIVKKLYIFSFGHRQWCTLKNIPI